MDYLIDTDRLIDLLANDVPTRKVLTRLVPAGFAMSAISYMELCHGTFQHPDPSAARAAVADLVGAVPVLPFTSEVAERCARIRYDLQTQGRRIRPRALDLQIAATAMTHDLTLVTRNIDDYNDIPGLKLYQVN